MKLFIAGDLVPTDKTDPYLKKGDLETTFSDVRTLVKGADLFIVNLECALTDSENPIRKWGPNLKGSPECAKALRALGVTDASLSNNHVYDFGRQGYYDTLAALDNASIRYTGVGENETDARKNHYMPMKNKTVALVATGDREYTYALKNREGIRAFDPIETLEDIRDAKRYADFVICTYHGGSEQCRYPSPRVRKICQGMVRAGADLVLCQHSHVIGMPEEYMGGLIVYGQGNFNFIRLDHPHWQSGLLLEINFDDDMKPEYTFHPVVTKEHGITLAKGNEKEEILNGFFERAEMLKDEKIWLENWHEFCVQETWRYKDSIKTAFEKDPDQPYEWFRHYLETDAHSDVWKELYPTWCANNTLEER